MLPTVRMRHSCLTALPKLSISAVQEHAISVEVTAS
jgi:hypothetical protein